LTVREFFCVSLTTRGPNWQERKRAVARLEKLRGGLALLDKQLDALNSSSVDKELMNSLRASSQAMRKAGIGVDVEEAEKVMNDLQDQIQDASEITAALATPLLSGLDDDSGAAMLGMDDVDRELGLIAEEDSELLAGLVAAPGAAVLDIPSAPSTMHGASLPASAPQYARVSPARADF
jgi:DNA-binding FrmR family transcriptional regulator